MPAKGPGGSTSFEDMSHEQMLAWLDQANAGTVQAAADRLVTAAKEIRKIAEELKVRPQWVEWKGEGAQAFRTWSADLANSTLRLGDFSEDTAKWLARTSDAITEAQVSIPRDAGSAQANLDAAQSARNDPDAASVGAKSASELAALAAHKEEVRQQAAAQMRKLAQSYSWSATQMNALERPRFPPPPEALVPPDARGRGDERGIARPGGHGVAQTSASAGPAPGALAQEPARLLASEHVQQPTLPAHAAQVSEHSPVRMDVDSVRALPRQPHTALLGTSEGPLTTGRAPGMAATPPEVALPAFGGARTPLGSTGPGRPMPAPVSGRAVTGPVGQGGTPAGQTGHARPVGAGRSPFMPGQGTSTSQPGRPPGGSTGGIVGGRPATPPAGRSTGAIPRGTVVGAEGTSARGPLSPTAGSGAASSSSGSRGQIPGGRAASPSGGVVGGASPQTGRAAPRPPVPDRSSGPSTPGAAVRNGVSGGTPHAGGAGTGRDRPAARTTPSGRSSGSGGTGTRSGRETGDRPDRGRTADPTTD